METTTTQCLKVSSLRKESGDANMDLEMWMKQPGNVYVGRPGRIFIGAGPKKKIFHYQGSKFANPFKVGEEDGKYTLSESLELYEEYLKKSGLIDSLEELRGKNLGCFCNQSGECHAKILANILNQDM